MDMVRGFTVEGIEHLYGKKFIDGNSVKLIWRGTDAFNEISSAVQSARKLICLQFYIYRNDETGIALAKLLKKKAAQGVSVYVLYDYHGSFSTPHKFWRDLRKAGINVRASYPFMWLKPGKYFRRDHRKLITIDSEIAFTGGLNIANEYWATSFKRKRPWRDTGVLMHGPVAAELTVKFFDAWCKICRKSDVYSAPRIAQAGELPVLPIFASSRIGKRMMRKLLYYSIFHADSEITLTTAYFIPSRQMVRSLANAVGRGVRVRVLVPLHSDVKAAHYASRHFYARLLKAGVQIYTYTGAMLHAKSYVFDSQWSIIGSANLDLLSLRYNDEGNVGILNEEFGLNMMDVFDIDLKESLAVTLHQWRNRPLKEKILEWFFSLFKQRL